MREHEKYRAHTPQTTGNDSKKVIRRSQLKEAFTPLKVTLGRIQPVSSNRSIRDIATMISTVVLAAGRAERMGEEKLLLPLSEKPVLQWVLESALAAARHEIVCVVRDLKTLRRKISLVDKRLYWLVNPAADGGQSSSLIAGLWAIDPKSDGALFLVGDQPMIRRELIHALVERFENSSALIVAPRFRGRIRNPVLIRRELFPELLQLTGDCDARTLAGKHRAQTVFIAWNDAVSFVDIDVREDYERLKRSFSPTL